MGNDRSQALGSRSFQRKMSLLFIGTFRNSPRPAEDYCGPGRVHLSRSVYAATLLRDQIMWQRPTLGDIPLSTKAPVFFFVDTSLA